MEEIEQFQLDKPYITRLFDLIAVGQCKAENVDASRLSENELVLNLAAKYLLSGLFAEVLDLLHTYAGAKLIDYAFLNSDWRGVCYAIFQKRLVAVGEPKDKEKRAFIIKNKMHVFAPWIYEDYERRINKMRQRVILVEAKNHALEHSRAHLKHSSS